MTPHPTQPRTVLMTAGELASLPSYAYRNIYNPPEGYFQSISTADQHPMVMCYVWDGLQTREVWKHVIIQDVCHTRIRRLRLARHVCPLNNPEPKPRSFNQCPVCKVEFPGPTGASAFIKHHCEGTEDRK